MGFISKNSLFQANGLQRVEQDVCRPRRVVAAVCYRFRGAKVEFLLVRTRAGRWTFPKGGVDGDATFSAAAAREAYEEAGVIGRMGTVSLTCYWHVKSGPLSESMTVIAYLCEVLDVGPCAESFREPTWFSAARAKRRLSAKRGSVAARELHRVVDCVMEQLVPFASCVESRSAGQPHPA